MLNRVTFTGLDDNTDIEQLCNLETAFPNLNIEWGILISNKQRNRYPSFNTIEEALKRLKNKSLHLCGQVCKDVMANKYNSNLFAHLVEFVDRVQLNFNCKYYQPDITQLYNLLKDYSDKEFIFQYNESNKMFINTVFDFGIINNWSILFDSSGGRGIGPKVWPIPIQGKYCSYAGGLGPENLKQELFSITSVTNDIPFGIDMEGNIRTNDEFDIIKITKCLEIISEQA